MQKNIFLFHISEGKEFQSFGPWQKLSRLNRLVFAIGKWNFRFWLP